MNIFNSILNVHEQTGSYLWQASEDLLRIGQKTYQISSIKGKEITLEKWVEPQSLLKIISKIIIVALLAIPLLIIRQAYRWQYSFKAYSESSSLVKSPVTKKAIDLYITNYDKKRKERKKEPDSVLAFLTKNQQQKTLNLEKTLNGYLADLPTYGKSSEEVAKIVYRAIDCVDEGQKEFAKKVYKTVSAFLRKVTDPKWKKDYPKYLKNRDDDYVANPKSYLYDAVKNHTEFGHALVFFSMERLRKKIKLNEKPTKIDQLIQTNSSLKAISKNLLDRAKKYLGLTWMHGTKAYVIPAAIKQTEGKLVCTGELQKRNIKINTGEMAVGASSRGINQNYISGVYLLHADHSINYSNYACLNADNEHQKIDEFLKAETKNYRDFLDGYGTTFRQIQAVKLLIRLAPDRYESVKSKLKAKLTEIYKGIKTQIFDLRPTEIYKWHDGYHTSRFYEYLKSMEKLEQILASNEKSTQLSSEEVALANIGIVVASDSKRGMPVELKGYSEENIHQSLSLKDDIQVVFTKDENIPKVKEVMAASGLNHIAVESMGILETAQKIDKALEGYFYDVYSIKKWVGGAAQTN